MKARALLLAILLSPLAAPPAEAARAPWWDPAWHFRLPLDLAADAADPVDGRAVHLAGASDVALLAPLDLRAAVRDARAWPLDGAGEPAGWTLDPASLRVVDASGALLPSRYLPFDLHGGEGGTLALLVPGAWSGERRVEVYFDVLEHAPVPGPSPEGSARLDALFGPGPGVRFLARVPAIPPDATLRLVVLPAAGDARVKVERLSPGAAPETLADGLAAPARLALPSADLAYDLRVTADAPVVAALETVGGDAQPAALAAPALEGGFAGRRFLLPALGGDTTWDVVGASRANATVRACDDGRALASFSAPRLGSASLLVPSGGCARLEADGPVVALARGAQAGGVDRFLQQAVSLDGGPSGSLLVAQRAGGHALLSNLPVGAQAFPLARPNEALSGRAGDPPRETWATRASPSAASEPWALLAPGADATALLGSDGLAVLAGKSGLSFSAPLATDRAPDAPATLEAALELPFAGTRVETDARALNGTPLSRATGTISLAGALATTPDGKAPLAREDTLLQVDVSKPAFLFAWRPGAPFDAFLPGLPPEARATASPVEEHGALLSWSDPAKEAAAKPGDHARLSLSLQNLGAAEDGSPLTEDVALSLEPAPDARCLAAWDARLAASTLPGLVAPGSARVDALVDVPVDARDGDCLSLRLVAQSSQDNATRAEARLVLRARSGFEPVLRALDASGQEAQRVDLALAPGVPSRVSLLLRNAGAQAGDADLSLAAGPGYNATLNATRVHVEPNGTAPLELTLTAPTGSEPPWEFVVEATSVSDPSARDQAVVAAAPRANATVEAHASDRIVRPVPGGSANATILLRNLGGDAEVRVRSVGALPDGWRVALDPPSVLLRAAGARNESGATLDEASVRAEVLAPRGAPVGLSVPLALVVEPTVGAGAAARVGLVAVAANDLALRVEGPDALLGAPASNGTARVTVRSEALAPLDLAVEPLVAPRGWRATLDGLPASLAPGEEARATLHWSVEPGAPPQEGNVTLAILASDATTPAALRSLSIPARTPAAPALVLVAPAEARATPGQPLRLRVVLRNDGNAPADAPATLSPEGIARFADAPEAGLLAPGATRLLDIIVNASADATLTVRAGEASRDVAVVGLRRDLAILDARVEGAPGAQVVNVTLENRGDGDATALLLRVRAGNVTLAQRALPGLAAGGRATHVLLVGDAPAGATVDLLGSDGAADAQATLQGAAPLRATPAAAPWAALLLALALRRRSS